MMAQQQKKTQTKAQQARQVRGSNGIGIGIGIENKKVGRRTQPVQDNAFNSDKSLQTQLSKIAELQDGITILKDRLTQSKKDLMIHFEKNPETKQVKYATGKYHIKYNDKKTTDGLSQKLVIKGLNEYFTSGGIQDPESATTQALNTILQMRNVKFVPTIEIEKNKNLYPKSSIEESEDDDDREKN